MIVIKSSDNSWLERTSISFKSTRYLQMIWAYVIAMSITPLLGFGQYGQDMVNIRFDLFLSYDKWNFKIIVIPLCHININENINFSCLASWSTNIPTEVTYIWLLVVFGGLLPTIGMIVSNGFVLHALCMVSYCSL